jgi:hypothetical protein
MEVGQGPNLGCSAKGKKYICYQLLTNIHVICPIQSYNIRQHICYQLLTNTPIVYLIHS